MNILDRIIADKRKEVALRSSLIPIKQLEASALFDRKINALSDRLRNSESGIIAEHKRRSPSKAVINQQLNVQDVATGYQRAGVCGMSVLTDVKYFGGAIDDLLIARAAVEIPLLRKEFIIDPYQLFEAKAYGADVILLIAAVLTTREMQDLAKLASELQLEVLLEVHDLEELQRSLIPEVAMIGVNNRNLKTFEVSLDTSRSLASHIPDSFVKVSESGISDTASIAGLRDYGYRGFLIGENFMKTEDPGKNAGEFISQLQKTTS
ncbi:indole-3-glycerol phosphate synthase TrpC [Robertkochia solimangrovi]|uniref:indole-3-glycerol phosphate synthase TrpC n=1 Tax=Robertkochia solimangrovi TaxID=2213046 RepID=UPI001180E946|nr:indole-3-glycerol phosphate synthase TrpC [Robertkochia solimangrovi]TRZ41470.1 indole-3-glycerol phosphate synthase TrpC [Robertkochia solimangrovi]